MRTKFLLAFVAICVFSAVASAQWSPYQKNNAPSVFSGTYSGNVFNTLELSYSPVSEKTLMEKYDQSLRMNAFSLAFSQARSILDSYPTHPLYLQYGLNLQYAYHTNKDQDDVNYNGTVYSAGFNVLTSFFTAKIPVNLLYSFQIPETKLSFMPYVGLHMLAHIVGRQKDTEWTSINGKKDTETEIKRLFKDEDMGGDSLNRFALGWQVGAKLAYDKLLFGLGYEGPMTNLQKSDDYKVRMSQVNISLGIIF